jgi:hypothetical protein
LENVQLPLPLFGRIIGLCHSGNVEIRRNQTGENCERKWKPRKIKEKEEVKW